MGPKEGRRHPTGHKGRTREDAFATLLQDIHAGEVAAHRRKAVRLPVELVVRTDGDPRVDLQLHRQLRLRHRQLLVLRTRRRQQLVHIHRRLRGGDAIAAEEQRLPVQHRVLTQAHHVGHVADVALVVREGVDQAHIAPVDDSRGIDELIVRHRIRVGRAGRVVVVGAVVDVVIPRRGADARAYAPVARIELRQQIETVRDQAGAEITVAVVLVRVLREKRRARLQSKRVAVLHGVVPAQCEIGIAGLDLERGRLAAAHQQPGTARAPAEWARLEHHGVAHLSPSSCSWLLDVQTVGTSPSGRRLLAMSAH
ncbi:hypothetical protein D3C87_1264610 [compost metagenome]